MSLLDDLKWRYAAKSMNGAEVPQEKLDYILEAARLAPSSSGLQPYKVFVITNKELLEKIKNVAWNQSQVTDCSHLLVFAAWDGYTNERVSAVFNYTMDQRGLPHETMDDYKQNIMSLYEPLGKEWQADHASKQSYISFAMAIAAAAEQKVDATPMEGFVPAEVDKLLELEGSGYKSTLLLTLGYRDADNDWLVNMKKVRTPKEDFITEIK
ncbi:MULTISPECIES: nitroreductase family protein [Leeuwenhoekiella]|uniref:Nitroreductase n=1 Tax=Leeuwenhoekiella palythoae TaxID=573501 RepID=A0A1M5ZIZ5_9FLAO|nr:MULTISPECIES: nitroreductase family protein [Leeuwenhoekiella]MEC7782180.1 nitroreductase family protein [Bacteroidota bacterium]HAX14559.1 NAD(P)H-dependent oxidoreductase [Leeuwenhoekiella sp.]MEC8683155.1 nitroreductase family protein [Bacteroidota bacterium]MEE3244811.1 nitroreductase family protein [Bacteroidota bacterium]RXG27763.1 nitroreductase [Leeuwenhoekiella palythoae]|tara:strand:+ start:38096 stop:38728 length:633 start_codon:yes stop_codon:yes gene_type:complete